MTKYPRLELERAALSGTSDASLQAEMLVYVGKVLGVDLAWLRRESYEARIRFAMHLAPRTALSYRASDPTPREDRITEHLMAKGRTRTDALVLGTEVAEVLDRWEMDRRSVASLRPYLLRRQEGRCANCRVRFREKPRVLARRDPYKPYHESPEELLRPEVDHIVPVSTFGDNLADNLQVLCRLCNLGKGDLRGVSIRDEVANAGRPLEAIPRPHRIRMFFAVIDGADGRCEACEGATRELTVRPRNPQGGYVVSNLAATCVVCAAG